MKLVLYVNGGLPHRKNLQAIQRMCNVMSIEYEVSDNYDRLKINNYDILLSCVSFINIDDIPENIKIILGPHFFVFPSDKIMGKQNNETSKRCVYNILSNWNHNVFLEFSQDIIYPLKELPFSVDTEKFRPYGNKKELDCLLYIKRRSNELINYTINLLNEKGLTYKVFRYGSYNEEEYLNTLQQSKFMLTLDAHESQGFALEEAMSAGIPLLVVDATSMYDETNDGINSIYEYLRPKKLYATSVPYWSDECGIKILDFTKLGDAVDRMLKEYQTFTPRDYILRTLSDEVCMKRILDYFANL
jgi:hypothetical protein